MTIASREDIDAAARILGLTATTEPLIWKQARDATWKANGTDLGRDGLGAWTVGSQTTAGKFYNVEERFDYNQPGTTYMFCDCQGWIRAFRNGRDCAHITQVRGLIAPLKAIR